MSNRTYPYYTGREKYRGRAKHCCCCGEWARFSVTIQQSIFRGDDDAYLVCEEHALLARLDLDTFARLYTERATYMCETVEAQHEETGRRWTGERRALPPRYQEIPQS